MTELDAVLEVRGLAREFAATKLRPHAEAWDTARAVDPAVVKELAELGFFGMLVPEEAGGMGFDAATWVAALEEIAWGEAAAAVLLAQNVVATDVLARFGSDQHREEWLPRLAAGEATACYAFADAADPAGAAAAGVQATRGAREAWRLDGTAHWVTRGDAAELAIVRAATHEGSAVFAVPRERGWVAGARADTLGMRGVSLVDITFEGVELDAAHRLPGFDAAAPESAGALGRLSTAAIAVGIARAALEHALAYAAEREQFGVAIRSFEAIQHKLAEMATRTEAARLLLGQAAARTDDVAASAMAKLAAAECAMFVTTEAVQIFGGYGYMRDYPVEKLMRDAKATQIMHGPSEVQRLLIARSLYA
jgi:alkylation response protein AidB-like acyl-CoA dehydrogenase